VLKLRIADAKFIRHLLRPTRGGAAAVLVVFAFLLFLAAKVGLTGIPLAFVVTSWFFKYAYVLFDHTVRGFDEPPTLDIQMVNPFNEQRPLAQLAILGLIYLAVHFTYLHVGPAPAIVMAGVALLALPASVAVLGVEGNLFKAAYPVAWLRVIIGLGPMYLLVLGVIGGYSILIAILSHWELWFPLQIAIFMFCVLSAFSALGGALYERRHELGLETWVSPERDQELKDAHDLRQSRRDVTEAYGKMRAGSHIECWQQLQDWLSRRGHDLEDYRWLSGQVVSWGDPRYITRLSQDHLERLLQAKRTGEALNLVAQRLAQDPTFRPKSAATTLQIARLAAAGGGALRVARTLLADFPTRFPDDPAIPLADELARNLSL
jgi:hypothetical protein